VKQQVRTDVTALGSILQKPMLFTEIISLSYENHRKQANSPCGKNAEFFQMLQLVVYTVTIVLGIIGFLDFVHRPVF
jgi:hypothetical protein